MKIVTVDLNEENKRKMDDITIIPISDVHIGDRLADLKLLRSVLERIRTEKNTYTIINGDMCNMALKDSKSDVYTEKLTPMEQIATVTELLEPIKNKILVMSSGNHEARTEKSVGIDVLKIVAKQIGIENRYANAWWYLYLTFGKTNKNRPLLYTITGYHGSGGGGRKSGGKINRLEEMSQNIIADLYLMGHTHKGILTKSTIYVPDYQHKCLTKRTLNYVMTNSFLGYEGGYAEKMGLPPSCNEVIEVSLGGRQKTIKLTI